MHIVTDRKPFAVTLCAIALLAAATSARGATITVPAGGSLQQALNAAQPGDVILLQAGATYTGNFTLPVKGGATEIVIRSSTPDAALPASGTRVSPSMSPLLARIQSSNSMSALTTAPGAHHFRLQFLEFAANQTGAGDIIELGDGSSAQTTLAAVPHDLVIDRCYIHGDPTLGQKRGIALNSASTTIVDSYIADIKAVGQDSQAIAGWNGPGPYTIVDNYLEAAGENVMFGGSDPFIPNLVPADILVQGNYLSKPTAWRAQSWQVKNLFELKNAERVVVDSNTMENNWAAAQAGYAILFTPRNQDGTAPWSVVQHVAFTNNLVRHVSSAVNILGTDNLAVSQITNDITIQNNLFEDVSGTTWGGVGRFLLISGGVGITIDHNTVIEDGSSIVYAYSPATTGFRYTNNIAADNAYGLMGDNASPGNGTVAMYFPSGVFADNVFAGSPASRYPTGNFYPASLAAVDFVNAAAADYRLAAASPYRAIATDGKDIGWNQPADASAVTTVNDAPPASSNPVVAPTPAPSTALWIQDSFAGVTGTLLGSHTPDLNVSGGAWTLSGAGTMPTLQQGFVAAGSGSGHEQVTLASPGADVNIGVDYHVGTGPGMGGIVFRFTDANNHLLLETYNQALQFYRRQGGVYTLLASTPISGLQPGTTHRIEVHAQGSSLQGWYDGALVVQATDTIQQAATRHGLDWNPAYDPTTTFGNFVAAPYGTAPAKSSNITPAASPTPTPTTPTTTTPTTPTTTTTTTTTTPSGGLWIQDSFTGVTGTLLGTHAPDLNVSGGAWTLSGAGTMPALQQGLVAAGSGSGHEQVTLASPGADVNIGVDYHVGTGPGMGGIAFRLTDANNYLLLQTYNQALQFYRRQSGVYTLLASMPIGGLQPGTTHRIEVHAQGSSLQGWYDGALVVQATDTIQQTATRHGLDWNPSYDPTTMFGNFVAAPYGTAPTTSSPAPATSSPTPAPATGGTSTTLVEDTFTDANGTLLSAHAPATNVSGLPWTLTGAGSMPVIHNDLVGATAGTGHLQATLDVQAADVDIAVDYHVGTGPGMGGVAFRLVDTNNYLLMQTYLNQLQIYRRSNGVYTLLASAPLASLGPGSVHRLEVRTLGTAVEGWFDGVRLLQITDSVSASATKHGLDWNPAYDPTTMFGNFTVTAPVSSSTH
jgi:hypothetical protein